MTETAWWEPSEEGLRHASVLAALESIRMRQSYRSDAFLHYARLYAGAKIDSLEIDGYACAGGGRYIASDITFNVVKNLSDTLTAKVTKSRPLPMFLTDGGDWSAQKKAKALGKFTEGLFDQCKVFEKTTSSCLDATVHGPGFVHVYEDGERIHVTKVRPWELWVDDAEAINGEPRTVYRARFANRRLIAAQYPNHRVEVMKANAGAALFGRDHDMVEVIEAWHLRSSEKSTDGRYVVCVDGATLEESEWERDYLPFPRLTMTPPMQGYYGAGLGELLTGIQYEINFTAMRIQKAHEMMGGTHWVVQAGSIEPKMMDNGHGTVWTVNGPQPQAITTQPIHPDAYSYLEMLKRYAAELSGISAMSSQSQKPAGVTAAVALNTLADIESERFIVFGRSWEQFHMEIARQMIDCARDLAKSNPDFATRAKKSGMLREFKFKDVNLAETDYVMQVFPTSALARTPSAKMEQVNFLLSMPEPVIDSEEARDLLDFPDLEANRKLASAPRNVVKTHIESMLEDGESRDPVPESDLDWAYGHCLHATSLAVEDGTPEENIDLLRRYTALILQMKNERDAANAPPPAQAPAMPMPEMAA